MMADTICSKDTSNKQGIVVFFRKRDWEPNLWHRIDNLAKNISQIKQYFRYYFQNDESIDVNNSWPAMEMWCCGKDVRKEICA